MDPCCRDILDLVLCTVYNLEDILDGVEILSKDTLGPSLHFDHNLEDNLNEMGFVHRDILGPVL